MQKELQVPKGILQSWCPFICISVILSNFNQLWVPYCRQYTKKR